MPRGRFYRAECRVRFLCQFNLTLLAMLLGLGCSLLSAGVVRAGGFSLASSTVLGESANHGADDGQINADGTFVVFSSTSTNLVENDTNNRQDVFRKDLVTGEVILVSHAFAGFPTNGDSFAPSISADGRFVSFLSLATSLVNGSVIPGITNLYLYDALTDTNTLVSFNFDDTPNTNPIANARLADNGLFILFETIGGNLIATDSNGEHDVYLYSVVGNSIMRVSENLDGSEFDGGSQASSISGDGRYVLFRSFATNVVGGDQNGFRSLYVRDFAADTLSQVYLPSTLFNFNNDLINDGVISGSGRYVVVRRFNQSQSDSQDLFWHDRITREYRLLTADIHGESGLGQYVLGAFSSDDSVFTFSSANSELISGLPSGPAQLLAYEPDGSGLSWISVNQSGEAAAKETKPLNSSGDGRYSLFLSRAANLGVPVVTNADNVIIADRYGFSANQNVTGSWNGPGQAGHGFIVEVVGEDQLLVYWFTFDSLGNPYWLLAVGTLDGNSATLTAYSVSGGLFPPLFDPAAVTEFEWGELIVSFESCTAGSISWVPIVAGFEAGSMSIERLTDIHGLKCE